MVNINGIRFKLEDVVGYEQVIDEYDNCVIILTLCYPNYYKTLELNFDNPDEAAEVLDYLDNYFRTFRVLD